MALDLLISPLISLAVNKAADSLIEQFCAMHNMTKNREKLRRHLLAIQEVIGSAESQAHKPIVRAWLDKLSAAAYEAVDVLDEFQYEALRREAIRQRPSSSFKKVTKCINPDNNLIFRIKMGKKLKNVLENINEIITEMNNFGFIRVAAPDSQPINNRPPTHSFIIESEIIGREDEKEQVMNLLLDSNRERHKVSILPIVGMGGAGKTTLAQLVYNEEKVVAHFELRMWVCVSNNFVVAKIVKSIIEVVENEKCELTDDNMEALQNRLCKIITEKKYLLVLDDVWNEEISKWEELKTLLHSGSKSGSVIIVTTRSKTIASIMGTLTPHHLAMLSEEDSWKLFKKRAFGEDEEPNEQLISLGRNIVGKCAGLPLALKTIGALMREKRDVRDWLAISESKIWDGELGSNEILPALKLSYDHLPSYMKQCFAFCAIFPQDYVIEKETLIQLWIANDFILPHGNIDLEDKCEIIFYELCRRSFFQEVTVDDYRHNTTCKMHDLMHDLAKQIIENQCGSILYFSMHHDKSQYHNLNYVVMEHPVVRTFLITSTTIQESKDQKHSHSLKSLPLRALKVRLIDHCTQLVGYMKHLRYLDFSYGQFRALPDTICTLYNLQTLKLSCSQIVELPNDMRYMANLRHLCIDYCSMLKRIPVGLGQLKWLKTLTNYIVECEPGRTLRELNNLDLRGSLNLSGLENVKDKNEASAANIVSKSKLYSLILKWGNPDSKDSTRDYDVLHGLQPHNELRYLNVCGYAGNDFPIWMNKFVLQNLKVLALKDCFNCTALPPVWCLPLLEELHLQRLKSLLYICSSIEVEEGKSLKIFLNLKVLTIDHLNNLVGWHEKNDELVAFPHLIRLSIEACPNLRIVPCAPLLQILCIENSREIKFRPPRHLVFLKVEGFGNVIPLKEDDTENYENTTLRELVMKDCSCFFTCGPLSKVALKFWNYCAFLEILRTKSCNALSTWPTEEFKSLKCLKGLYIGDCDNFTGLSHVPSIKLYEEDILPRLESLKLYDCPKFVEIPRCSKTLKTLALSGCPVVSEEGLNWLRNLQELESLYLYNCEGLESLPEGLEFLTSLRDLIIKKCSRMESFPRGLQQRLPALQFLRIAECPVLERRCRSGGDYHHLVSAIPDLSDLECDGPF